MKESSEFGILNELKSFDTPAITNLVATYPEHHLCLGLYNPWTENWYTDQSIRCMYPELGRTVGYAVTCVNVRALQEEEKDRMNTFRKATTAREIKAVLEKFPYASTKK